MEIDFVAFAGDCLVHGQLDLGTERLTELLNQQSTYRITQATLESLADGHAVQLDSVELRREELFAVQATGPRGLEARRIYTVRHRLILELGPYTVVGNIHSMPGVTPLASVGLRRAMLPLTEVTISFVRGNEVVNHGCPTLVVNGALAKTVRIDEAPAEVAYGA